MIKSLIGNGDSDNSDDDFRVNGEPRDLPREIKDGEDAGRPIGASFDLIESGATFVADKNTKTSCVRNNGGMRCIGGELSVTTNKGSVEFDLTDATRSEIENTRCQVVHNGGKIMSDADATVVNNNEGAIILSPRGTKKVQCISSILDEEQRYDEMVQVTFQSHLKDTELTQREKTAGVSQIIGNVNWAPQAESVLRNGMLVRFTNALEHPQDGNMVCVHVTKDGKLIIEKIDSIEEGRTIQQTEITGDTITSARGKLNIDVIERDGNMVVLRCGNQSVGIKRNGSDTSEMVVGIERLDSEGTSVVDDEGKIKPLTNSAIPA